MPAQGPPPFPPSAGIYTVIRDPRGGWFVGGDFAVIGDRPKANLVRFRRHGQVDDLWTADTNAPVLALATSGARLYVGGAFSTVAGDRHLGVAAMRRRTGRLATAFAGSADGYVYTLLPTASRLYLGGSFSRLDGSPRAYLGAVVASTGRLTSFAPTPNRPVSALLAHVSSVVARGSFERPGATVRPSPPPFSGTQLFVGGGFSHLAGTPAANLGCVTPSGVACSPTPPPPAIFSQGVQALQTNASTLIVGGVFASGVSFLAPSTLTVVEPPLARLACRGSPRGPDGSGPRRESRGMLTRRWT